MSREQPIYVINTSAIVNFVDSILDERAKPIYVIDTSVIVDYVDIIPDERAAQPDEPSIDLSDAHLVIPTTVVQELSKFKAEKSEHEKAANIALERLRKIFEGKICSMDEAYHLEATVKVANSGQTISILPVHKNFKESVPFCPSDDDTDGQIMLAALTIVFLEANQEIDGSVKLGMANNLPTNNVVILTNDDGLAIRASGLGLLTSRYSYKVPEPYTGRRDIVVPPELFKEFLSTRRIERNYFEKMMPKERTLVANEFIVMSPEDQNYNVCGFDPDNNPHFKHIGRYDATEDAIVPLQYIERFPLIARNAGQAIYAEALENPDFSAVICTGPAGSGKTFMAAVYGYKACNRGIFMGIKVIPCENRSKIGALPGDLDEKMDPEVQPLKNALRNYLIMEHDKAQKDSDTPKEDGSQKKCRKRKESFGNGSAEKWLKERVEMIWKDWFSSTPIEHGRGLDFTRVLAIYDEFQDQNPDQADTLIKRIGEGGKIIITGDINQIHTPHLSKSNNGLVYAAGQLYDIEMVASVCFTEDEVVRHPLVKLITQRQKAAMRKAKKNPNRTK